MLVKRILLVLDVPELDNDEESVSAPTEGAPSEDADEDEGNLVIDDTKVGGGIVICRLMVASYGPTDNTFVISGSIRWKGSLPS